MELDRIKILIDRYLEAETTLDEEREIAEYFSTSKDIPQEYEPLRAMFLAFGDSRAESAPHTTLLTPKEPKMAMARRRRWWLIGGMTTIAAAAACLLVMLTPPQATIESITNELGSETAESPKLICYIDGKMVTNESVAYNQANKILEGMANNMQLAMAEVERYNVIINI